jgi:hypothetical protein
VSRLTDHYRPAEVERARLQIGEEIKKLSVLGGEAYARTLGIDRFLAIDLLNVMLRELEGRPE